MPKDAHKTLVKDGQKSTILTDDFAVRLANLLRPLLNITLRLKDGRTCKKVESDSAVVFVLEAEAAEEKTPTGGMVFRGFWSGGESKYQEVWKVAGGSYAGTYVCVNPDGTILDPWQGVDWVDLAQTNSIGNWT